MPEPATQPNREGLGKRLKKHWMWIAIAIAAATLIVVYLQYRRGQQGAGAGTPDTSTSGTTGGAVPGGTSSGGAPSGVDLSSIQAAITGNTSLLNQILAAMQQQGALAPMPVVTTSSGDSGPGNVPPSGPGTGMQAIVSWVQSQGGGGGGGGNVGNFLPWFRRPSSQPRGGVFLPTFPQPQPSLPPSGGQFLGNWGRQTVSPISQQAAPPAPPAPTRGRRF